MYQLHLIAQVLANFIAAERPQLGGVGAVSELVAESLKAIGDVVKRRGALRKYRTLMGEDSMSYEPLVKQIASDLFDSKTSKRSGHLPLEETNLCKMVQEKVFFFQI